MPVIPPLDLTEVASDSLPTLHQFHQKIGQVPQMYRTLAYAPKVLDAAFAMSQAIRSDLDPKLRELVYLKVIQLTDCHV